MHNEAPVERANPGLHKAVATLLAELGPPTGRALDLGTGTGAMAGRLAGRFNLDVEAADVDGSAFSLDLPFRNVDLNDRDFSRHFDGLFDLITAVEVIEHLDGPINFLLNLRRLLAPSGFAVVTTPYLESITARVKFLLTGRLRLMDEWGDPTHTTPIFRDLLERVYLPTAGLRLIDYRLYPPDGFVTGRPIYARGLRVVAKPLERFRLAGDNQILVLRPDPPYKPDGA